ncbi:MAG TPA: sugar phosphate isomerase/epimerase family protein [Phycisphaerae bacterium]|nr:sugar phosphate isomerase/epimerase family protein [Phycisphaerae bacterium]
MRLGYNTNGFAHHRLSDVIAILADLGYTSIAITLDHHFLDPFDRETIGQARIIRERLANVGMTAVVECGSRFLLDPSRKHWPTLLTPNRDDRRRRLEFLTQAIDIAVILQSEVVSFWSGAREPGMKENDAMTLLVDGCGPIVDHAIARGVNLGFEPEPDMFIDTMDKYRSLRDQINHARFGLTLDLGHLHCLNDGAPADRIREFARSLFNIHIEDMRRGVHAHLPIGEGDMDFPPIFRALTDVRYEGPVNVELSRHSHDAVNMARRTLEALKPMMG